MSLHEAQETDRQATAALDAASEALDDHTSTVGERCLLEDRRPTSEEIDRFDELCEAWDAAAQTATEAATNLKAAERFALNRFSVTRQLRYSRDDTAHALDLAEISGDFLRHQIGANRAQAPSEYRLGPFLERDSDQSRPIDPRLQ